MAVIEIIIYVVLNVFYFIKYSYSLYTYTYIYVVFYYPIGVAANIIVSMAFSYYKNQGFLFRSALLSCVISLLIFFTTSFFFNFGYGDVIQHYYLLNNNARTDMFSFETYAKNVGNIFEVKNKSMVKYKKFCYLEQGYDESFSGEDMIIVPCREFTNTIYKINRDMYIIYNWKSRIIVNSISKEVIKERAIIEFSKLGNVEKIKINNCNVFGKLEGEEIEQLIYIVPRNNQFYLEFNTDRKNKLLR